MTAARYRLRVQKVEEFFVDVTASSIDDARRAVESQTPDRLKGHLVLTGALRADEVGVNFVWSPEKPAKFRVIGKHLYVENGVARRK